MWRAVVCKSNNTKKIWIKHSSPCRWVLFSSVIAVGERWADNSSIPINYCSQLLVGKKVEILVIIAADKEDLISGVTALLKWQFIHFEMMRRLVSLFASVNELTGYRLIAWKVVTWNSFIWITIRLDVISPLDIHINPSFDTRLFHLVQNERPGYKMIECSLLTAISL